MQTLETDRWGDLQRRGFVVVPGFLGAAALDTLRLEYERSKVHSSPIPIVQGEMRESLLTERVRLALPEIVRGTDLTVNTVRMPSQFYDTERTPLPFHIDFLQNVVYRETYNYLNFWVPIVKPDPKRSGLSIVPMDTFAASDPAAHALLARGGKTFYVKNDRARARIDGRVHEVQLSRPVAELAISPEIHPGDALVLRADVLHATQDNATSRLAVACRAYDDRLRIEKKHFFTADREALRGHLKWYSLALHTSFTLAGKNELSTAEVEERAQRWLRRGFKLRELIPLVRAWLWLRS